MGRRGASSLALALLVGLTSACGAGGTSHRGHTVTFVSDGSFPPTTIVGRNSPRGCVVDTRTLVQDAGLYYAHSTGLPGPADLYYYEMRFAFAHVEADGCTNKQLGEAMRRGLTARQREFLLHNVASNLHRAFRAALDAA